MYSTQGIVLKKIAVGEADALFSVYTRDFGKIRALAQGVKKEEAKLKGHLEPLNLINLGFVLSKNGERLTQAVLLAYWPQIRNSLEKTSAASYLLALMDQHCLPGQKDEPLWDFLVSQMAELEKTELNRGDFRNYLKSLEIKFLKVLGYGGETDIQTLGKPVVRPL